MIQASQAPIHYPFLDALIEKSKARHSLNIGVVYPLSVDALKAAIDCHHHGIAHVVVYGPEKDMQALAESSGLSLLGLEIQDIEGSAIEVAQKAVADCAGVHPRINALMKGSLHTDELLSACLRSSAGLRTSRRISHIFKFDVPGFEKPLFVADAVVNIDPGLNEKADILANAIEAMHQIGVKRPKVAIISATESVNEKIKATLDAKALCEMAAEGAFGHAVVEGPMGLDLALSRRSADIKGYTSQVSGDVDLLVAPDLNAGNILFKSLVYAARAETAGVILGAKVPIVLTSRSDSAYSRLASCAMAAALVQAANIF
ncbi:MAG: bifunctional enoyl-CoA hydratase/phosphate acetyltransferase [Burkholderiaceae bacterium]